AVFFLFLFFYFSVDIKVLEINHVPLRLSGGEGRCSGRLEVYHNAVWGSVCDDHWDISDAQVVCRQLGFFGAGEGVVWLNRAECRGNEVHLWDCPPSLKNHTDCSHKEHAGLTCAESMRVMLVNGSNPCAGRVEVHQNGQWGTVCDWGWDIADAAVVCRELGCGTAVTATFNAHFGAGSGSVSMAFVNCSGSETALKHCSSQNVIAWYCNHSEDAGVVYYTNLRLVNGSNSCSGRVERQYFSKWGTVCDACWDMRAASVLCRQLNCGTAVSVVGSDWFGEGSGEIWADVFDCDGNETKLSECSISSWSRAECSHRRDVGFICSGRGSIRLVGSGGDCAGRLEVFHSGSWGTVCDDSWDIKDAHVVCRELQCGVALSNQQVPAWFGPGSGPIWLDEVECEGNETSLWSCSSPGWGKHDCQHKEDVGVVFSSESSDIFSI
uniref:SRCR domain-containing protein n=1 Tax=Cyprinus carpio TaxID=7962 RepID=A0A8C2E6D4_CYPCA